MCSYSGFRAKWLPVATVALLIQTSIGSATMYDFTRIADTSGLYRRLGIPSINESGTVAFGTDMNDGRHLLQTWDGVGISTLYSSDYIPFLAITEPTVKINNVGAIAFRGRITQRDEGIFSGNGGPLTTIASSAGEFSGFGTHIDFNDSGNIVFQASLDSGGSGVFATDAGTITMLAHSSEGFDFYDWTMNNLGTVAYMVRSVQSDVIYYHDQGGPRTTLVATDIPGFTTYMAMNDLGQVLVNVADYSGVDPIGRLSIVSALQTTVVADTTGQLGFPAGLRSLTDDGKVAFLATLDGEDVQRRGIFTGPDANQDRILFAGDSLFDGIIDTVQLGEMNTAGQIAFRYILENGIQGIAVANPIPEPTTLALVAAGCLVVVLRRSRAAFRKISGSNMSTANVEVKYAAMQVFVAVVFFVSCSQAHAKKPDNSGGGGGSNNLELVELLPVGALESRALGINDNQIVVGWVDGVAGIWDGSEGVPAFSVLPGAEFGGAALDINGMNQIVGFDAMPKYWPDPQSYPIDLPLPDGFIEGRALAISGDGIIAGDVLNAENRQFAAVWRVVGTTVFGPTLLTGVGTNVTDVASLDSGINRVVGSAIDGSGVFVATAWDVSLNSDVSFAITDSMTVVPERSQANAITEAGDITGIVRTTNPKNNLPAGDAFVIRDGSFSLLSSGRNEYAEGFDLNATEVVGAMGSVSFSPDIVTSWDSRNRPENLTENYFQDLWLTNSATGINGSGDIIGDGIYMDGYSRAWLLREPLSPLMGTSAVPELPTVVLAFLGFAGAVSYKRRTWR